MPFESGNLRVLPTRRLALGTALVLTLSVAAWGAAAQPEAPLEEGLYSAATVLSELENLYSALQVAHADLYVHRPREAYDRYFQQLRSSIDRPMTHLEVVRLFMPFVAFGKIGHARIDYPVQEYITYAQAGGTVLPLDIRVEDGRVLITHSYAVASGKTSPLAPGTELLALNGQPATEWLERIGRYVSAERSYMVYAQLESMFPRLVWLDGGRIDTFRITVRPPSGEAETVTVDAVPVGVIEEQKAIREAQHHERKAELLKDGIAYLRPGPFYAAEEGETLETFEAFVEKAFRRFIEAGAQDLILDLRNNPGGDNSFSDPMIAWFANKPFRFASRFEVKASPQTREVLQQLAAEDPDGLSAQMLRTMKEHKDGDVFTFEIPKVQPGKKLAFTGRVWTLVNRHTYSNGTTVAAIIQDLDFGKIVGEETSDIPSSYASSARFTLPETGIAVTYPKAYFVRPNGSEAVRGVMPDHPFEVSITASEEEGLAEVQAFILSQRPSR